MIEFNPNHLVIPTQKDDLLKSHPDEEINQVKEVMDMKISLLGHLDIDE